MATCPLKSTHPQDWRSRCSGCRCQLIRAPHGTTLAQMSGRKRKPAQQLETDEGDVSPNPAPKKRARSKKNTNPAAAAVAVTEGEETREGSPSHPKRHGGGSQKTTTPAATAAEGTTENEDLSDDSSSPQKKRGGSQKTSTSAAAVEAAREHWEETDRRLLAITKSIMFASGDSNSPCEENARMLLGLMQHQMRMIMEAACDNADAQGRDEIALRDILMHMARHKMVLARLLNHAKAAHQISSISRQTREENAEEEEKEEDGVPDEILVTTDDEDELMTEDDDSDQRPGSTIRASKTSTLAQIEAAIDSLDAGFQSADLVDPSFEDATRNARMKRMATRVKRFRDEIYNLFSEARQMTYVSRTRVKKINGVSEGVLFISWLGLPPLDNVLTYVLSWLAKEVVTQVDQGVARTPGVPAELLDPGHYEEALRKNLGWREREDVLFGYIAPREEPGVSVSVRPEARDMLFFSFFKSLVGKDVVVEFKDDLSISGTLHSVDQYLNMKVLDISLSAADQERFPHMMGVKDVFVRGSVVRYVHLCPEHVDTQLLQDATRKEIAAMKM